MAIINGTTAADTLTGTIYDDTINGLAGNDTIKAGAGNDTITGGAGSDVIDGGTGTNSARFSGNRAKYVMSVVNVVTTVKALSGTDGTDALTNVQYLRFADQTIKSPAATLDTTASTPTLSVKPAAGNEDT